MKNLRLLLAITLSPLLIVILIPRGILSFLSTFLDFLFNTVMETICHLSGFNMKQVKKGKK
jgi:hypothetical protein